MNSKSWIARAAVAGAILALLAPLTAQADPLFPFTWGSYATGSTAYGVYDTNNTTILQNGDAAQFIWAGPDGLINPPARDGAVSGDDQVLDFNRIQDGAPYPLPLQNKGYLPSKTFSLDSADPWVGGVVYIRAWNASALGAATAYGDSATTTLTAGATWSALRWYTNVPDTAVTVTSFKAMAISDGVQVSWDTASEIDLSGFNAWRSNAADGQYDKLNIVLIAAKGGPTTGASYTYQDLDITTGQTYYYKLENVDTHGGTSISAPVSAAAGVIPRLYLPVVLR